MTANALLQHLARSGIRLEAQGPELIVEGPETALSNDLMARLKALKAELLALLRQQDTGPGWDADDWRTFFDERAAIREHDGGAQRAQAEVLAFDDAVDHWLCLNPAAPSDPGLGCVHCGLQEQPENALLPLLTHDGHVWVHDRCWEAWRLRRRDEARASLRDLGLCIGET